MTSFFRHRLALACVLALSAGALPGNALADAAPTSKATLPKDITAGPCVEGICEYRLQNGLRVLLFPDASKPTVTINLTYLVGSVKENYGETGMAHLLEHLQFKGTPTYTDIPGEMKKRGIGYNATTSLDRTNYFSSFPANDDTLDFVLKLEADRMLHSFIAKKDLDSEMTVVRNELERNENNPGSVLNERLRSTAYLWHNYGLSSIGARCVVDQVPIEHLQAFYKTWYQPDNAVLVVAGRFDAHHVLTRIAGTFGPLKKPSRVLPVAHTVEPVQDGEREVAIRRSGDIRITALTYHIPAVTHADTPALIVLGDILSHTPGGRLQSALVDTKLAIASNAGAGSMRDPGTFNFVMVLPKDGDAGKSEAALLAQAEHIADKPITAEELADTKQRIDAANELALNNVNAVGMAMSEYVAAGDWRLWFVLRDAIDKVTLDDVNRVAKTYLIQSNRTLARFVPTDNAVRAQIPQAPSAASLVDGYKGRAAVAAGEVFDPSIANIAARSEIYKIGDKLTVSLLPKKNRGGSVVFSANFRFADEAALQHAQPAAPSFAGNLLMKGSQTLTREQIDKRFVELKSGVSVSGGAQSASISLQSRRDALAEALALAADILRHPAFPQREFDQLRLQIRTGLEFARKEPGFILSQAMEKDFDPWPAGHSLAFRPLEDRIAELDALTLDDVRNWHRTMYGTSDGQIAVVGDFDPAQIKPLLAKLFADWAPGVAYVPIDTHYFAVAAQNRSFETPDKSNAIFSARMNLPLNDEDPDYAALRAANDIFGGSGLKSRLADRVRQKDGLSYSIGSSLSADASIHNQDNAGSFSIEGIAAPQNMAKLEAAVRAELARFVKDGITAAELKDAVDSILVARQQARASDANVAGMLNSDAFLVRKMQQRSEFDAKLKSLTVAQVNAAIRKFIAPGQLSVYTAGDFANADKAPAVAPAN